MIGTISYFPFIDNSMIATKQLQQDGTSKIIIYKPIEIGGEASVKYVTPDELNSALKGVNEKELKELKEELKSIKELKDELTPLKNDIKNLKKQLRNLEED